jgi:putative transposase
MQSRHNAQATKGFFEGVLGKTTPYPRVAVTDGLRSYNTIAQDRHLEFEHRRSKYLNNRTENSHQPTRRRERRMRQLKSPQQAQNFLSVFDVVYHYFHPKKHLLQPDVYHTQIALRCKVLSQFAT